MRKSERSYILLIAFFILGVAIALQIRSTLNTKKINASKTLSVDSIVNQIATEQKAVDQLKVDIDDNLQKRDKLVHDYFEQNMDYESGEEWKNTMFKAGFTEVKGPGIVIKLDDAAARQDDTPLNWLIIHDQDIKILLNELKSSGAQAIAINGERITAVSEQVCAGPTILINGNRYSVPYKIEAIGDPELLFADITKCPKIAEMIEFKIRVDITKSKEITISKFSGITQIDRYISGMKEIKK